MTAHPLCKVMGHDWQATGPHGRICTRLGCKLIQHWDGHTWRTYKPPLCEEIGHNWQPTTAPNYRQCERSSCRVTERLHDGTWIPVARVTHKRQAPQEHTPLWEVSA